MIKIWSLRFSVARGNHWSIERECAAADTAHRWLEIFRRDEPNVTFIASVRKPPLEKVA